MENTVPAYSMLIEYMKGKSKIPAFWVENKWFILYPVEILSIHSVSYPETWKQAACTQEMKGSSCVYMKITDSIRSETASLHV